MFSKLLYIFTSKILTPLIRIILVSSSISPIILILGVSFLEHPEHPNEYFNNCVIIFISLFVACVIILNCFRLILKA